MHDLSGPSAGLSRSVGQKAPMKSAGSSLFAVRAGQKESSLDTAIRYLRELSKIDLIARKSGTRYGLTLSVSRTWKP